MRLAFGKDFSSGKSSMLLVHQDCQHGYMMQQNTMHMEALRFLMEENVDVSSFNYSFIAGVLICMENIKVLYRYYVYNVEGSMIPFIGGVLLLVGAGTILDKSLNYKMVIVLFDI